MRHSRQDQKRLLALVHIAKKDLALEDESYRSLLHRIAGQNSARGMTEKQLNDVLAEFKRLGWEKSPRKKRYVAANRASVRKIFVLWGSLRDHLACKGSRAGLRVFVERMTGVSDPNFLDDQKAQQVIEALKAMQKRKRA
ncbi:DUF1018 domain-containing protein [Saccharibacter sp. 17.LH.SD]|uniref:regulatory protein GemA n=1 Tax=Saccharibacter sp. 17.LH.SD TaxID=2689393 RepID=UPI00136BDA4B|nr:regulatory protein GemA [Saccharibacter sp. 17.LH.SD]MXV43931.1 DUF1018 domain-containing protein [Saccharibacter sp. 17.LH.SD]